MMNSLYPVGEPQEVQFHVQELDEMSTINTSIGICAHRGTQHR
jgi:hypothetical protein